MKILFAALLAAAAVGQATPAPAASGYEVVADYNYPPTVVAGPFPTIVACGNFMNANGMYAPYHCTLVFY